MTTIMIGADSMNRTQTMNLVIALGGNALTPPGGTSRASSPDGAANVIADLVELGYNIVVTHGNGPQVGYALLKDVAAPHKVPRLSLTYLGAQTEGELGSLVALAIRRALEHKNLAIPVTAIVTHAIVNPSDPDALTSTKPIGLTLHITYTSIMNKLREGRLNSREVCFVCILYGYTHID